MVVSSLVETTFAGPAQIADLDAVQLAAHLFGDDLAAGQNGDVLEHGLAAVAKAGRLNGNQAFRACRAVC